MTNTAAPAPLATGDIALTVDSDLHLPTAAGVRVQITDVRRNTIGEVIGYAAEIVDENAPEGDDGREIELRADEVAPVSASSQPAHVVEVFTAERAEFLATFPALVANGHRADHEGSTVTLSDDALAVLAELDPEHDGHYSGAHIYIGGTGYRVERV